MEVVWVVGVCGVVERPVFEYKGVPGGVWDDVSGVCMVFSVRGRLGGGDGCMVDTSVLWEVAEGCARC